MNARNFYRLCLPGRRLRAVLAAATIATGVAYFAWRVTVLNFDTPVFSALFLLAELFGFCSLLMTLFICWRAPERVPSTLAAGATVDVFITTYNEPLDVIRTTAVAAIAMRHPHVTWLLDDGNRAEIRELARELGCSYLARGRNTDAKAGNLNYALKHSSGEFIAVLDADHVPEEWFLERLLGYFSDPQVAFVQAQQDYFTEDAFQFRNDERHRALWHDQSFFYRIGQAGRDYWNAASFCGTTAMLRRSALEAVGGFATETVTEDMHTAVRLQKRGYKSVFHPEPLAFGIAAPDYGEFLQQRWRWGHGNVQTLREERLPFCKGLTWPQRLCYTALGLHYFEGWTRFVLYITPAAVLIGGLTPIADTRWFFLFFLPYFVFACLLVEELGRGSTRLIATEEMAMARFPVYMLAAIGLVRKRRHFRITAKRRGSGVSGLLIVPLALILGINAAGLAVVVLVPPERLTESLSGGAIAVVCAWAMFHVIVAARIIWAVIRDAWRTEQPGRAVYVPVLAATAAGERLYGRTVWMSADAVGVDIPADHRNAEVARLVFFLPGRRFAAEAAVEKRERAPRGAARLTCQVSWREHRERDAWNRLLHACTWQRALAWPGSHTPTLLDRVAARCGWRIRPQPEATGEWRPVICLAAAGAELERLAFLRVGEKEDMRELMEFPHASGDTLHVVEMTEDMTPLIHSLRRLHGESGDFPWPGAEVTHWREMTLASDAELGKAALAGTSATVSVRAGRE